jgi:hypothetical protein
MKFFAILLLLAFSPLYGDWVVTETTQTSQGGTLAILVQGNTHASILLSGQPSATAKQHFLSTLRERASQGNAKYYGSSQPFPSSTGESVTLAKYTQEADKLMTANVLAVFSLPDGQSLLVNVSTPISTQSGLNWSALEAQFHQYYNNLIATFETVL